MMSWQKEEVSKKTTVNTVREETINNGAGAAAQIPQSCLIGGWKTANLDPQQQYRKRQVQRSRTLETIVLVHTDGHHRSNVDDWRISI